MMMMITNYSFNMSFFPSYKIIIILLPTPSFFPFFSLSDDLEQDVADFAMRLFHLVQQHYRVRAPADSLGQHAALLVAHIAADANPKKRKKEKQMSTKAHMASRQRAVFSEPQHHHQQQQQKQQVNALVEAALTQAEPRSAG